MDKASLGRSLVRLISCLDPNATLQERIVRSKSNKDHLSLRRFMNVTIDYESFMNCKPATSAAQRIFPFKTNFVMADDKDVAFQMLNDDLMSTVKQVWDVRCLDYSWTVYEPGSPSSCASTMI